MFYKVLFLLACYNMFVSVRSFIKEYVVIENGELVQIPKKAYISIGATVLFHIMVLSVCTLPSFLF